MADAASNDHEFGGVSTDLKLSMVEGYLSAFTKAIRSRFSQLWYIDAFAGTGVRTVRHDATPSNLVDEAREARIEQRRGSAQIALDVTPQFDHLIFIDKKRRHVRALSDLKAANPSRSIDVVRGEANSELLKAIAGQNWSGKRAVLFLDPYGMHVHWTTLEAISATKAIDLWYLVSLEGLYRQAPLDRTKLTDHKRAAITRLLGASNWEDEWYAPKKSADLGLFAFFDESPPPIGIHGDSGTRTAGLDDIEAFVKRRLETIFPAVLRPLRLNNKAGVPAFLLFFAVSNPDRKAWGLATKIANHILKAGRSSQSLPR